MSLILLIGFLFSSSASAQTATVMCPAVFSVADNEGDTSPERPLAPYSPASDILNVTLHRNRTTLVFSMTLGGRPQTDERGTYHYFVHTAVSVNGGESRPMEFTVQDSPEYVRGFLSESSPQDTTGIGEYPVAWTGEVARFEAPMKDISAYFGSENLTVQFQRATARGPFIEVREADFVATEDEVESPMNSTVLGTCTEPFEPKAPEPEPPGRDAYAIGPLVLFATVGAIAFLWSRDT